MFQTPKVLVLLSDEKERHALEALLHNHALLVHAKDLPEMKSYLQKNSIDVLFCGWSYYSKNWSAVLDEVRQYHPNMPVIVLSRQGGEREWLEVLESGGFDLLAWPSPKSTLLAVVEQAVASHDARKLDGFLSSLSENRLAI